MINDFTEKHVSTQVIFNGKIIDVYRDDILLPDGRPAEREYIRHVGAVCIVALTDDNKVVIERQFRYPVGKTLLEIPAGRLNSKDEDPALAALRELKEETGAEARELHYLGPFFPTPAYSDEVIHMYMARGLTFGETSFDDDEFLTSELVPISEVLDQICSGNVPDGKTQAAILRVCRILNLL